MLIYIEQSRNVYENKRNMDKMTAEKSDIYGNSTWILQKNSGFDGQFSLIGTFRAGFVRRFAGEAISTVARRAPRIFRQQGFCNVGFKPALGSRGINAKSVKRAF